MKFYGVNVVNKELQTIYKLGIKFKNCSEEKNFSFLIYDKKII